MCSEEKNISGCIKTANADLRNISSTRKPFSNHISGKFEKTETELVIGCDPANIKTIKVEPAQIVLKPNLKTALA